MLSGPVRYNWKGKLVPLGLAAVVLGFFLAFLASGIKSGDFFMIGGSVAYLIAVALSPLRKFIRTPFRPAFTISASGLTTPDGAMIPWGDIEEAVFFAHSGYDSFGVRLTKAPHTLTARQLAALKKDNLDYSIYRMPFVTMTRILAVTQDDLIATLRHHGVRVRVNRKPIDVGDEERV